MLKRLAVVAAFFALALGVSPGIASASSTPFNPTNHRIYDNNLPAPGGRT
jgi:hypothetical protein